MISLRLPEELEMKINERARQERKSRSELIKASIVLYLESTGSDLSPYELGKDLFGKESIGPADLSTRRKAYLKKAIARKHAKRKPH